jgi:fused signal recognition particle receptor
MFKNLRDRLKKIQDDLEDNLDAQLEAQLEAELAEAVAEARGEPPEPVEDASAVAEGFEESSVDVSESVVESPAVEPDVVEEPTREPVVTPEPAPIAVAETEPFPEPTPAVELEPVVESSMAESERVEEPRPEPPVATPEQKEALTPTPVSEPEPTPTPEPKPEAITGRKKLTEQEIEARLAREMGEAVEIQKEVEQTVGDAPSATKYTINEDVLEDILWELEVGLLESDVALPVIEAIKGDIKEQLLSMQIGGKSPGDVVEKVLKSAIQRVLSGQTMDFDALVRERVESGKLPFVVMFVGVNGTGKTTSIARIAHRLKQQGYAPVLAAGDTFRAGAIEQLTQHADTLGVKIIKHKPGADPAAVAYDAIEHAKARNKPVVLLDTAGRMQTNTNLMDEMDKIRRIAKPDLTLFVGDSLAGNDAVEQARRFDEVVDIDGAILTKVDVDAKGGAALSVAYTINKPLVFVGTGQGYDDLMPFDAKWLVDRLFGDEA